MGVICRESALESYHGSKLALGSYPESESALGNYTGSEMVRKNSQVTTNLKT